MSRCCLNAGNGCLKVVKGTAAAGTGNVFRLRSALTRRLKYAKGGVILACERNVGATLWRIVEEADAVNKVVEKECATIGSRTDLEVLHLRSRKCIVLERNHRVVEAFAPQFVDERTLFAEAVGMVALRHNNHFGVLTQEGFYLGVTSCVSQEQELHLCSASTDERK